MSSCITVQIRWISNQLKCIGQFYTTVQTFQQFSHFSTSSTRKWCPFGRQDNRKQNFLSRIFMSRIFSVHDRPIILYRFCVSHRVRWQWETSAIFRYFWWTTWNQPHLEHNTLSTAASTRAAVHGWCFRCILLFVVLMNTVCCAVVCRPPTILGFRCRLLAAWGTFLIFLVDARLHTDQFHRKTSHWVDVTAEDPQHGDGTITSFIVLEDNHIFI